MLRCDELTERVTDYLERQLSLAPKLEIYLHLRRCRDCRTYFEQMEQTVRLLGQLPAPHSSAEVSDALLARFHRARLSAASGRMGAGTLHLVVADRATSANARLSKTPRRLN